MLYYGCETWKTASFVKKLQTSVNGYLWKILRIPWTERVRNEVVWERTGQISLVGEVDEDVGDGLVTNSTEIINIARQALRWKPQDKGEGHE